MFMSVRSVCGGRGGLRTEEEGRRKKPPTERDGIRFRIWGFVSPKMMLQQKERERESGSCGLVLFSKSVTCVPNEKGTPPPRRPPADVAGSGRRVHARLREDSFEYAADHGRTVADAV